MCVYVMSVFRLAVRSCPVWFITQHARRTSGCCVRGSTCTHSSSWLCLWESSSWAGTTCWAGVRSQIHPIHLSPIHFNAVYKFIMNHQFGLNYCVITETVEVRSQIWIHFKSASLESDSFCLIHLSLIPFNTVCYIWFTIVWFSLIHFSLFHFNVDHYWFIISL